MPIYVLLDLYQSASCTWVSMYVRNILHACWQSPVLEIQFKHSSSQLAFFTH